MGERRIGLESLNMKWYMLLPLMSLVDVTNEQSRERCSICYGSRAFCYEPTTFAFSNCMNNRPAYLHNTQNHVNVDSNFQITWYSEPDSPSWLRLQSEPAGFFRCNFDA